MNKGENIYISSSCLNGKRIGEIVYRLAEQGISTIELSGGTKFYSNWFADLKELQSKYNLNYVFHAYFPPMQSDIVINLAAEGYEGERSLKYYLTNLDKMEELSCDTLSIHAGFFFCMSVDEIGGLILPREIENKNEYIKRFTDRYLILEQAALSRGISVILENNVLSATNYKNAFEDNPFMLVTYEDYKELRKYMKFKLLLDVAHLNVSCRTLNLNFENELKKWAKEMTWVHISHNDGIFDQHGVIPPQGFAFEFCKNCVPIGIPISLETHGSLEQILSNYSFLKELRGRR